MTSNQAPRKLKKADSTAHPELVAREFDLETQKCLEDIDGCQNELDVLNEQASDEIVTVEQKFQKLRKPHYDRRTDLIKNIPNFWTTAFTNNPDLSSLLNSEGEEDCFGHLSKLEVVEADDIKSGFRIEFYFTENPYFLNKVLVKEYQLGLQGIPTSVSTTIEWKEGMNLIPQHDASDSQVSRKRKLYSKSFFEWFSDHFDPSGDGIADVIKDDLWQNPLQYFLTPDVDINNGVDDDEEDEEEDSTADEDEETILPQINNQLMPGSVGHLRQSHTRDF